MSGSPRRSAPYRAPAALTYWRPRARSPVPAVLVGVLGLGALAGAQVAVAAASPETPAAPEAAVAAPADPLTPTGRVTPSGSSVPETGAPPILSAPVAGPTAVPTGPLPTGPATVASQDPSTGVSAGLSTGQAAPARTLATVELPVGAVVDDEAAGALEPVLAELRRPGAAPVVVVGAGDGDGAVADALAEERARAVVAWLVERGAPPSLLRTDVADGAAAGGTAGPLRGVRVLTS
ncbi:hypothetical protein [Aquipuribacter nitratireducens]|uniref:OmpA-like domain-containing protein n=1 Tax=Aquipuribacter nitratireducens TaxID=650104 RepID=A0ABW0GMD4_9MICO